MSTIRDRAEKEADTRYPESVMAPENEALADGFVDGAIWAYEQLPGREEIARVLALTDDYDGCFERMGTDEEMSTDAEDCEFWLRRADAVLAPIHGAES